MWYALFKHVLVGPLLRLRYRAVTVDAHHLPRRGPAILAANHQRESDSLLLPLVCHRRLTFIAKSEYFARRSWRRWGLRRVGQIPVDRSGGDAARRSLAAAGSVVSAGGVWGVYPEGTRSPDGRLHRGHTGVARVALAQRCPIVPVAITRDAGRRRWRRPVVVRFGPPIAPDGDPRDLTDRVMTELARLGGQSRSDDYAAPPRMSA